MERSPRPGSPPPRRPFPEHVFERRLDRSPLVSLVLIDWSCRESFHIFHYLARQTAPRESFEVLWLEYHDRRPPEIQELCCGPDPAGTAPPLDQWLLLGMPAEVYYHKHLMYNVGLVASRGKIVTFCDSDAILMPTFVESIARAFEKDPDIVLQLDQVRNNDKRFYPFNYPTIDEVLGPGAVNWENGITTGLAGKEDPLHSRNYGACMSALRSDLIAIGGADEHRDYLGHICGPYEMTFRLVNAGKREVWHSSELVYHVWHPGQAGARNRMGPHDGQHMSSTALSIRSSGRIFPLVENPAVRMLRRGEDDVFYVPPLSQAIPLDELKSWSFKSLEEEEPPRPGLRFLFVNPLAGALLLLLFFKMLARQLYTKSTKIACQSRSAREKAGKIPKAYDFLKRMSKYNLYALERCKASLDRLAERGVTEVALYGSGEVAEALIRWTLASPVKIGAVYDDVSGQSGRQRKFHGLEVRPLDQAPLWGGDFIVASLGDSSERLERLSAAGIERSRIAMLG